MADGTAVDPEARHKHRTHGGTSSLVLPNGTVCASTHPAFLAIAARLVLAMHRQEEAA